jgi:hypothetical protein
MKTCSQAAWRETTRALGVAASVAKCLDTWQRAGS